MPVRFCKFHGFGNDYIVVEKDDLSEVADIFEFTRKICQRNTGVGGDGIALLEKLDTAEADYVCRIINPDGSEAGFSGNGTRCAVAYLYYRGLWSDKKLKLKTKSGIKNYDLLKREENTFWYLAELGKPQRISNLSFQIPEFEAHLSTVTLDVGNPVCAVFVEDFDQMDWRKIGARIESLTEHFPARTNVVFIKIIDRENVEIRIWERGAGETSSSGTCSIAAAVASAWTEQTGRDISVRAEGGTTETVWREDDEMLITGRADLICCGDFFGV